MPPHTSIPPSSTPPARRWRASSLAVLLLVWAVLQLGGIFTPGLLDDVDSIYIQVAREMLQRHDFVTPTIDGIRFFDKPPLMYWMAAGSMRLFGVHDWAARLPLALGVLALILAVYALGLRFYSPATPVTQRPPSAQDPSAQDPSAQDPSAQDDRGGLYAALAIATALGPYLYTRFYIPDILIALWMTLAVHLLLIALDNLRRNRSALLPCLGFAAVTALSLLTKGLIGVVFPLGFALLYLAITRQLRLLRRLRLVPSTLLFLALAAPWHILAALRNPPIPMPPGLGLPARAGWAWFYLYNEHIARFLGRRIPHDYGQVPVLVFWLLLLLWLFPWVAFLPAALLDAARSLRPTGLSLHPATALATATASSPQTAPAPDRRREAALACLLWAALILGFFTLSSRQEYYHLPALPALALLVGGLLASADARPPKAASAHTALQPRTNAASQALRSSLFLLMPLGTLLFLLCGYFALTAPRPLPSTTLHGVLSSNPAFYNLSLGHIFDLTGTAMGYFKGPLLTVALCMFAIGPVSHLIRRGPGPSRPLLANLLIAAAMTGTLLAAHEGLVRFYPILGSRQLALAIDAHLRPGDIVAIDGELTSGSTLLFYTPPSAAPIRLVNGRRNGPWFGSFWPGAPRIFPDSSHLCALWAGPHRVFLLTYHPLRRSADLQACAPAYIFASSGGKTVLSNRTDPPGPSEVPPSPWKKSYIDNRLSHPMDNGQPPGPHQTRMLPPNDPLAEVSGAFSWFVIPHFLSPSRPSPSR